MALHIAHQTRNDGWIAAAADKLHEALADSMAARREFDRPSTCAQAARPPGVTPPASRAMDCVQY